MKEIENIFLNKIKRVGSVKLLDKVDALEFIQECHQRSIAILGINGFNYFHDSGKIQPRMEDSIDFTLPNTSNDIDIYNKSIEFLNSRPAGLLFEIAIR